MTSDFLAGAGGRWPLHAGRRKSRSGRKSAEAAAQLLPEPPALPAHAPHPSSALGDGGTPLLPPSSAPFPPWEPRHGSPLPPPAPGSRGGGGFPVAQHGCPLPAARPPPSSPAAGGRRWGRGRRAVPCPQPGPRGSPHLGRRGGRRGHQHGASAISAKQLRPPRVTSSAGPAPAGGGEAAASGRWAEWGDPAEGVGLGTGLLLS